MLWKLLCNVEVKIKRICLEGAFENVLLFKYRAKFLLWCLGLLCCCYLSTSIEIACDDDECFDEPCCFITETAINATDTTLSGPEDETVSLLDISRNRKIKFLPIRVGDKFPKLTSYVADRCDITKISLENFENLFHLGTLNLYGNRLTTIESDTFHDLVSLKILKLGEIKKKLKSAK